jgi:opacity protein-like surface antigen
LVPPDASPKGGVFGFQVGHNWQWGPVVGGLEIDFSGANINESTTFSIPLDNTRVFTGAVKIDELLSARGRLGYLILPNLLAYGTAGIGLGHERFTTTMLDPNPKEPDFESRTSSATMVGWVAGAGLEWKFWDHWLLRGEWLHYDFGRATHIGLMPDGGQFSDALEVRTTVDVARAALSYKF